MPAELITPTEYARRRGCHHTAVLKAIKSGRISLIDGKIDPKVADIQWTENTRPRAPRVPSLPLPDPTPTDPLPDSAIPQTVYDLQLARAKRETHEANIAEMKERQKAGELVELQAVEKASADIYAQTRNALERIPDKLANRLAAESDPFACRALMVAEIEQTLTDLAAALDAMADQLTEPVDE